MAAFKVQPRSHATLQDWVAAEKGYFEAEGLTDIGFITQGFQQEQQYQQATELRLQGLVPDLPLPVQTRGAYESAVADPSQREDPNACSNVNTFCHWAVNMSVGGSHGRMWAHAYSWTVSGIYVAPDSPIDKPEDLAGVPIAVGLHSGSHFSTVQALEHYVPLDKLELQFVGGPNERLGLLLEGRVAAANGLGMPCYILEQNGYKKIIDNSFIQGFLISGDVDPEDTAAYFRALRRAQRDIDLDAEPYKPYLMEHSIPKEFRRYVKNLAGLGVPTRVVFEEYTQEMYEETRKWMNRHDFFPDEERSRQPISYAAAMMR